MKFEVLKKDNLKRNIIIGIFVVLIISTIIFNLTKAKYRSTASVPIIDSVINYTKADINVIAIYQENDLGEYENIDTVPASGYTLNTTESYCEIDGKKADNIIMIYSNGSININNITTKGTKCYLYFNKTALKNTLLTKYSSILTRTNFNIIVNNETTGTIYKSTDESQYDNDGEVYYFAGSPTDNWISFAGFYWRIIRINGNGSVRMIYSGSKSTGPVTTGDGTQIGTSAFNSSKDRNEYVGFIYTLGSQRGSDTDSTIKKFLDNWFEKNLSTFISYIDVKEGFCGDRELATGTTFSSTGGSLQNYAAYERVVDNKQTTFKCSNKEDIYTVASSDNGNNLLTYPIGLLTADEAVFAGAKYYNSNDKFFLNTGATYYTMTPHSYNGGNQARVFNIDSALLNGVLGVTDVFGVRPVINLRSDVTIIRGTGTSTDPFVITE